MIKQVFITSDNKQFDTEAEALEYENELKQQVAERKAAIEKMAELQANIEKAFREAQEHADKYYLTFTVSPAYGMGGTYVGTGNDDDWSDSEYGWQSSSQSC